MQSLRDAVTIIHCQRVFISVAKKAVCVLMAGLDAHRALLDNHHISHKSPVDQGLVEFTEPLGFGVYPSLIRCVSVSNSTPMGMRAVGRQACVNRADLRGGRNRGGQGNWVLRVTHVTLQTHAVCCLGEVAQRIIDVAPPRSIKRARDLVRFRVVSHFL